MSLYTDVRYYANRYYHRYYLKNRRGRLLVKLLYVVLATLVVIAAGLAQYQLAHVPRPLYLDSAQAGDKFSKAGGSPQNQLVIKDVIVSQGQRLLSHDTQPNELVRVVFEEAQISAASVGELKRQGYFNIPESPGPVQYIYKASGKYSNDPAARKTTRAKIDVVAQAGGQPFTLFINPVEPRSGDKTLSVVLRTEGEGGGLIFAINTRQPGDSSFERRILIGEGTGWNQPVNDNTQLEFTVPPNKKITFYIIRIDGTAFSADSPPRLFDLGAPKSDGSVSSIQAREVFIERTGSPPAVSQSPAIFGWPRKQDNSLLRARATTQGEPLSVGDFHLYPNQFTVRISGYGTAWVGSEGLNSDILETIEKNKIISLLLLGVNGALLGWLWHSLKKLWQELRKNL
jgi:hypothetical protein